MRSHLSKSAVRPSSAMSTAGLTGRTTLTGFDCKTRLSWAVAVRFCRRLFHPFPARFSHTQRDFTQFWNDFDTNYRRHIDFQLFFTSFCTAAVSCCARLSIKPPSTLTSQLVFGCAAAVGCSSSSPSSTAAADSSLAPSAAVPMATTLPAYVPKPAAPAAPDAALVAAAKTGNLAAMAAALDGADAVPQATLERAVFEAIDSNQPTSLQALLDRSPELANCSKATTGDTPLHAVARLSTSAKVGPGGCGQMAAALIGKGAKKAFKNRFGCVRPQHARGFVVHPHALSLYLSLCRHVPRDLVAPHDDVLRGMLFDDTTMLTVSGVGAR